MDERVKYVLWWKYPDNSGAGIERIYADIEAAKRDREMLQRHSDKTFIISEAPEV